MRCYDCGLTGHCTGTKACRAKQAEDNEEQVTTDINGSTESAPEGRTADVLLTALNGGVGCPTKARLIVDSGTYKTLLTEELWENIWPERMNSTPQLKESSVRFIPYRNDRNLELLGTARCLIQAGGV